MSDNKDCVKIQHLIDEAERMPKEEAITVLRLVQATVAGENGNWSQVVGTAIERIKERQDVQPACSSYHIANRQITNFVKIMRAAYDIHIFECNNGLYASNFEEFIGDLGWYFNTEIKHTRNLLSAAKRTENFMSVFDRLHYLAQAYYDQDEGLDVNNKAVARESQQRIDFDWGQSL